MTELLKAVDVGRLAEAIVVFLTGVGLYLQNRATRKDVAENTKKTEETKSAVESVQVATVDRLDYDRLRRMEAALLTLDSCQPCRAEILALTERRRQYPPAPAQEPAP